MELTRIEKENEAGFLHLGPESIITDDDMLRIGVIDDDGAAVSVCVAGMTGNLMYIKWLYTAPENRGLGGATILLRKLAEYAKALKADGIVINFEEKDQGLDLFLMERGFLVGADPGYYRIPVTELAYGRNMERLLAHRREENRVLCLAAPGLRKAFKELIESQDLDPSLFYGISPQLCAISVGEDKSPSGGIFISQLEDGDLYINYLLSDESVQTICDLVGFVYDRLMEMNMIRCNVIFTERSGKAVALAESLTETDREEYMMPGRMQAIQLFEHI